MKKAFLYPTLLSALIIASCSSGDSGTTPGVVNIGPVAPTVAIDQNNGPELAVAATEAAKLAVNSENLPTTLPTGSNAGPGALRSILSKSPQSRERFTFTCSEFDVGSGNITADFSDDLRTFVINYACTDVTGTFSGSFSPDIENWTSFTGQYNDFSVAGIGINGNITCTNTGTDLSAINSNCTYGFNGIDGLNGSTFSVSNMAVNGDNSSGYSISATVNDPATGAVSFTTTNLTFGDCAFGVPISGTLNLNGTSGTSATVTYNDCNSFTLIDSTGTTTVYNWADLAA